MNFNVKISLVMLIVTAATTTKILAQSKSSYEIGINVGTLIYQGDLSQSEFGSTKDLKPAVGVYVSKDLNTYFSFRANLNIGKIGADESQFSYPTYKKFRNFMFTTPITEFSTVLVWNILGQSADNDYRKLSPYIFAGAGITFLNIKRDWSRIDTTFFNSKSSTIIGLGKDTLQATPRVLPIIPLGIGLKYAITDKISLKAEATYRLTFSDYLDGFSYAANPNTTDKYYGVSIGVSFNLARNNYKCPIVRQ